MLPQTLDDWLLGLPGVTREVKWGHDLVYLVCAKMFAVLCLEGAEQGRVSYKVGAERFLELTDQEGIIPAPYLARAYWITLPRPELFAVDWVREGLLQSYRLVRAGLSRKQQAGLAGG